MLVVGIESSCDESALALLDTATGELDEWVYSQIALHQEYGGVVPDLASREHVVHFPILLQKLQQALRGRRPDRIAVTQGPGLAGCLAVGIGVAKALALAWSCPLVGVNHLRGHAFSPFLPLFRQNPLQFDARLKNYLPHLGLIVSGGNTILFRLDEDLQIKVIGETVDDAAGEALDKGAKLLGMPYPGGALIERLARTGDARKIPFPRFISEQDDWRFSFSGLKTSLRYKLEAISDRELEEQKADYCASYQAAVLQQLLDRTVAAVRATEYRSIGLSGGVSNNKVLRSAMEGLAQEHGLMSLAALPEHTGDNAAMITFSAEIDPITRDQYNGLNMTFIPSLRIDA